MFTDPTTLFALALCIGILGLLVLILPLLMLFWSQMEPQLAGMMGAGAAQGEDDYSSHAALPRLMKSFDDLAELDRARAGRKAKSSPSSRTSRKASTGSRSKASTRPKTVKAAPSAKTGKGKAPVKKAQKKVVAAKGKSPARAAGKARVVSAKAQAEKPGTARGTSKKARAVRRTPAGAKRDPILGLVYTKKPKEIDDLKQIKGVAKVIEGKLHQVGIYTFRQIVEWDAAAIDAFSEKLSFKGRIRNEGWQKQCAKFHAEKYGEKLG